METARFDENFESFKVFLEKLEKHKVCRRLQIEIVRKHTGLILLDRVLDNLDREVFIRNRKIIFNYIESNCTDIIFTIKNVNKRIEKHKLYFEEFDTESVLFKLMFS